MSEDRTAFPVRWIAVCIVGLLAAGAATYFLVCSKADRSQSTASVPSNVQPATEQDLPVHVVIPPQFGASVVPELQNASDKRFALRVTVRRPGSAQQHEWRIELQPNQTLSLVRQGGWSFANGDELELVQDGYRSKKVRLQ